VAALAAYSVRKESSADTGECLRPGCDDAAADGSDFCAPHRDAKRDSDRAYRKRLRRRRRRLKLCRDCGVKLRKATATLPAEKIWCTEHRIRRGRLTLVRSASPGVETVVEKSERIARATREHDDGRTRYHGQGKRGQQPQAQLNRQDIEKAEAALAAGRAGLQHAETEEVKALPRIQREDVKREAAHLLDLATRHIDDVLERIGHFKMRHGKRDGE